MQNAPPLFDPIESVPLSPVEDMFWNVEEGFAGAVRGAVVVRLDGYIDADMLAAALRQLQHRHPKLRAVIAQGSDGRRRPVRTGGLDAGFEAGDAVMTIGAAAIPKQLANPQLESTRR